MSDNVATPSLPGTIPSSYRRVVMPMLKDLQVAPSYIANKKFYRSIVLPVER